MVAPSHMAGAPSEGTLDTSPGSWVQQISDHFADGLRLPRLPVVTAQHSAARREFFEPVWATQRLRRSPAFAMGVTGTKRA